MYNSQNFIHLGYYSNIIFYVSIATFPAVQKLVLVSSASEYPGMTKHVMELPPAADLDKTVTELSDWLLLIDQMLKSNIVTVGDPDEINTTIARMKVKIIATITIQCHNQNA